EDRLEGHALARAGLADQADGLPGCDLQRHPVDRADDAVVAGDLHPQVADLKLQQAAHDEAGRSRSASPSPISDSATPVITTARPGTVVSHHWVVRKFCPAAIMVPQSGVGGW